MSVGRRRLTYALLLSLLVHTWLLSLSFGGQGLWLPGFGFPWRERRIEATDLSVVLVPPQNAAAGPAGTRVKAPMQASFGQPAAGGPALTPSMSPAPTLGRTAEAIVPKATRAPRAKPTAKARPVPGAATGAPRANAPSRTEGSGDAVSTPIPEQVVIAVERSDEATLVVPAAPSEPTPVIAAAPVDPPSPEAAMPSRRDAGDVAQARIEQEPGERAVELAKLDPSEREVQQHAVQQETARAETARQEAEREGAARQAAAAQEAARHEVARQDALRVENARLEAERQATRQAVARQEATRQEAARTEAQRVENARLEAERQQAAREAVARQKATRQEARKEAQRVETARLEAERQEATREAVARQEATRQEAARQEVERVENARLEAERQEAAQQAAAQQEAERQAAARQAAARQEAARVEAAQEETERREAVRRAIGRQLDEEAARRDARRDPSSSGVRRGRLFGRADPNAELILYAEAWERKVQLNMTFDMVRDAARRPHTDPLVTVAIRSDGSVESVTFVVSSGVAELDEAIRRIVESQLPYPAFPARLAREFDVIEIRRTWRFDTAVRLY